jgi:hypothetical protein
MELTRTSYIRILRIAVAAIIIIVIVAYAIWRSLNYARGPAITILEPANGTSATASTLSIKGHVDRVNNLTMNGAPISIDEQGNFVQSIVVFPGTNKITFVASDQFGRSEQKELDIVGTVDFKTTANTPISASTSAASSTGL